jgi:hypothetical protein
MLRAAEQQTGAGQQGKRMISISRTGSSSRQTPLSCGPPCLPTPPPRRPRLSLGLGVVQVVGPDLGGHVVRRAYRAEAGGSSGGSRRRVSWSASGVRCARAVAAQPCAGHPTACTLLPSTAYPPPRHYHPIHAPICVRARPPFMSLAQPRSPRRTCARPVRNTFLGLMSLQSSVCEWAERGRPGAPMYWCDRAVRRCHLWQPLPKPQPQRAPLPHHAPVHDTLVVQRLQARRDLDGIAPHRVLLDVLVGLLELLRRIGVKR